MAIYKIDDVLKPILDMKKVGYEYIEISELPEEDDMEACLNIDAIIDISSSEGDFVDAVQLPEDYICPNQLGS